VPLRPPHGGFSPLLQHTRLGPRRPQEVIAINKYELMLIVNPNADEERQKEIVERLRATVEGGGGRIVASTSKARRRCSTRSRSSRRVSTTVLTFTAEPPARGGRAGAGYHRRGAAGHDTPAEGVASPRSKDTLAGSLNVVVLVGNLTRDPEMRATPGGTPVCQFASLSTTESRIRAQASGQIEPITLTSNVSAARASAVDSTCRKAARWRSRGVLRWSEWETPEGQKRQKVDVTRTTCSSLVRATREPPATRRPRRASGQPAVLLWTRRRAARSDYAESPDDDIPF